MKTNKILLIYILILCLLFNFAFAKYENGAETTDINQWNDTNVYSVSAKYSGEYGIEITNVTGTNFRTYLDLTNIQTEKNTTYFFRIYLNDTIGNCSKIGYFNLAFENSKGYSSANTTIHFFIENCNLYSTTMKELIVNLNTNVWNNITVVCDLDNGINYYYVNKNNILNSSSDNHKKTISEINFYNNGKYNDTYSDAVFFDDFYICDGFNLTCGDKLSGNFVEPTETSGTYINRKYFYINVSFLNYSFVNQTIHIYNSTSLLQSNFTMNLSQFYNFSYYSDYLINSYDYVNGLRSLDTSENGTYVIFGTQASYVYVSNNSGTNFIQTPLLSGNWYGTATSDDGQYMLACKLATSNTTYVSNDYGINWNVVSNYSCRSAEVSPTGQYMFMGGNNNGHIFYSDDYGITWHNSTTTIYPIITNIKTNNGTLVYASVYNGYIIKSTDGGDNWTNLTDSGINTWFSIDINKSSNFIVAVAGENISYPKYSNDSGNNWSNYSNTILTIFTSVSVDKNNADVILLSPANYPTNYYNLITYDGGNTWSNFTKIEISNLFYLSKIINNANKLFISNGLTLNVLNLTSFLLSDDIYYFNVTAYDNDGIYTSLETRNVIIDTINPQISFNSITENGTKTVNYFIVNISVLDENYANTTLYVYNSNNDLIQKNFTTSDNLLVTISSLSKGYYYFNASSYDFAGNYNWTETRNIYINVSMPAPEIQNKFLIFQGLPDVGTIVGDFFSNLMLDFFPALLMTFVILVFVVFVNIVLENIKNKYKK